jgi:hypothetical protein
MTTLSGTASFEVTDYDQPRLLGTGSFHLQSNELTDFQFTLRGYTEVGDWINFSIDESVMDDFCQCRVDYQGFHHVVLTGDTGFFVWDFEQGIFSINFTAPRVGIYGTSEDNASGGFTEYDIRADVSEPATAGMFLLAALACVAFGRWFESAKPRRASESRT